MPADDSDPLAQTATADGKAQTAGPSVPLGRTLGRYKLQSELGAGGMGVVHAAFDPDLERRVALKVLLGDDVPEARQRLLREARAMARLTHPNVVTVHEVGTADGRDYVAMELVDGTSLADWLAAGAHDTREIIAAFVAAGRGLAAAHAAEIVHRDFKPHNVLRHKDGRICVTDFGLARGLDPSGMETTVKLKGGHADSSTTPSSLSGLTQTGSVLGTPAYMAPEQWSGGKVGPPADQFAFCVALWEALAGRRPFKGGTYEALQASIEKGTGDLDDSKIPRRLRPILKRGLELDPENRWPSMNTLLAAITRAERRPGVALAIAGGAVIVGIAIFLIARPDSAPSCEPPAIDPATVEKLIAPLASTRRLAHAQLRSDLDRWLGVRAQACKAPRSAREPRLTCLDAVLARIEVAARAASRVKSTKRIDVGGLLVEPAVCEGARVPRLAPTFSPQFVEVTAKVLEHSSAETQLGEDDAARVLEAAGTDPCALAVAHAAREQGLDEAARAADRCGDDRLVFDIANAAARQTLVGIKSETEIAAKIDRVEALAGALGRDGTASVELLRAQFARRMDKRDEAIRRIETARELFAARGRVDTQILVGILELSIRALRATPADVERIPKQYAELRELAVRELGPDDSAVRSLDQLRAMWLFATGDVEGAANALEVAHEPRPTKDATRMTGRVVGKDGKPVAHATVVTAQRIQSSSATPAMADESRRTTTTRVDGTFEIADATVGGAVLAYTDDLRSIAHEVAADVTLVLLPTARIEGKVELRGLPPQTVNVIVQTRVSQLFIAPVGADGSFVLAGIPRGKVVVQALRTGTFGGSITGVPVDANQPVISGIHLDLKGTDRTHHVIVRSTVATPVSNAQVLIVPGLVSTTNAHAIRDFAATASAEFARPLTVDGVPPIVKARAKTGDIFATLTKVPLGEASACAVGLPANMQDPEVLKALQIQKNVERIIVPCVPVKPTDEVTVVEVPPWPRFD